MAVTMTTIEEPMLSRLDRLDNIVRQLEEIRNGNIIRISSPKSSCASSTPSSNFTLTSDGQLSMDFSPTSLEKHCRPIDDVIMETEVKGTLIERLVNVEHRVSKICMQLEEETVAEKRRIEDKMKKVGKKKKGGFKQMVKSCVTAGN